MSVGIADIAANIRQARKDKGLTQRELGKRVGLPQSHISKIESGAVDLQVSSLAEIARALDLEVKLVPRKALPAIEGTVRAAVGTAGSSAASRALDSIQKELQLADQIRTSYPNLKEIETYRSVLKNIQALQIDNQSLKTLQNALKPSQDLAKFFKEYNEAAKIAKQVNSATSALQQWRNLQVHLPQIDGPRQRPAYRLEDDE
jgi:transcriptional regulator with XRE-family HTH domain